MSDDSEGSDDVVIECDLPHSPQKVWTALTDQDLVSEWLMPTDMRPEVGSRFRLQSPNPDDKAPLVDCEVIEAVPLKTLQWRQTERESADAPSFIESIVTFELAPSEDGTYLRIVHDRFRRIAIEAHASASNAFIHTAGVSQPQNGSSRPRGGRLTVVPVVIPSAGASCRVAHVSPCHSRESGNPSGALAIESLSRAWRKAA